MKFVKFMQFIYSGLFLAAREPSLFPIFYESNEIFALTSNFRKNSSYLRAKVNSCSLHKIPDFTADGGKKIALLHSVTDSQKALEGKEEKIFPDCTCTQIP